MFEYSVAWNEKLIQEIYNKKPSKHRLLIILSFLSIGSIFLFNKYTLILGILVIIITLFFSFVSFKLPHYMPSAISSLYGNHKHMHETLKYGVTETTLWVKGEKIDAKCSWENLLDWKIKGQWLILRPSGFPQIYFPINEMKKANVFESILIIAKKHGKESKS